jgi:hypothetical protein
MDIRSPWSKIVDEGFIHARAEESGRHVHDVMRASIKSWCSMGRNGGRPGAKVLKLEAKRFEAHAKPKQAKIGRQNARRNETHGRGLSLRIFGCKAVVRRRSIFIFMVAPEAGHMTVRRPNPVTLKQYDIFRLSSHGEVNLHWARTRTWVEIGMFESSRGWPAEAITGQMARDETRG